MSDYQFRLANKDDIPEITSIYRSLVGTPGCTWNLDYPNAESALSDLENGALYVLETDGKIVAAASMGDFNELSHLPWASQRPCELARIGVLPAMQKHGVGSIILQNVIRAAKEKGFDGMRFLVSKNNIAALALYDKNGFEKCGETFMYGLDFYCYQICFRDPG